MISGYVGLPGAGKSYLMAAHALKLAKGGRKIYSNVWVDGAFRLTLEELLKYGVPRGAVLFFDEVQQWANSRRWADLPPELYAYFSQSRKAGLDLLWSAQDASRVDVTLREVTNEFFICKCILGRFHLFDKCYGHMALAMQRYDKYSRRWFMRTWGVMNRYDTLATVGHSTTGYEGYEYARWGTHPGAPDQPKAVSPGVPQAQSLVVEPGSADDNGVVHHKVSAS